MFLSGTPNTVRTRSTRSSTQAVSPKCAVRRLVSAGARISFARGAVTVLNLTRDRDAPAAQRQCSPHGTTHPRPGWHAPTPGRSSCAHRGAEPRPMKICVLTTSYPRDDADVAGLFIADAVSHLRSTGAHIDVVSPASFRHFGIAYGNGIA